MEAMFASAQAFNQPLAFDASKVTNVRMYLFVGAQPK